MKTHSAPPVKSARPGRAVKNKSDLPPATPDLEVVAALPAGGTVNAPPAGTTVPLRRVRFGYFNPDAQAVHVVGSFNQWDPAATPLVRDALGDWTGEVDLPPGEHRYRFVVDGEWRDDPSAMQTARNPYGGFDAIVTV